MSETDKAVPERCPRCGSDDPKMLGFNCYRDDVTPHWWHHTASSSPQTTPRKLDGKFSIIGSRIVNTVSGEPIPEDEPLFLLRGRDHHALEAIHWYLNLCRKDCNELHIAGIKQTEAKFTIFATDHPERMKQPGVTKHLKLEDEAASSQTRECKHTGRCIGPVACLTGLHDVVGIWRWIICENCGSVKRYDYREIPADYSSDERLDTVPWTKPTAQTRAMPDNQMQTDAASVTTTTLPGDESGDSEDPSQGQQAQVVGGRCGAAPDHFVDTNKPISGNGQDGKSAGEAGTGQDAEKFWMRTPCDEPAPWGDFINHAAVFKFAEAYAAARVSEALHKYGRHLSDCNQVMCWHDKHEGCCDCGFEAVLSSGETQPKISTGESK